MSHERVIRKLKTEGFKTQKVQEDLQRDAAGKCDVIQELQDKVYRNVLFLLVRSHCY